MFKNIGSKIKSLAEIIFYTGLGLSAIFGLILTFQAENPLPFIILVLFGGVISWLLSFNLYGTGELIESNSDCKELLYQQNELLRTIRDQLKNQNQNNNENTINRYTNTMTQKPPYSNQVNYSNQTPYTEQTSYQNQTLQ